MEQLSLQRRQQFDQFLSQQQTPAYKMAYALTHNRDDALELVQDSMFQLVKHYSSKPCTEWSKLFYRILQNRIRDFHRRRNVNRLFSLFQRSDENTQQQIEQVPDKQQHNPQQELEQNHALTQIMDALKNLPIRQQQTFLLRAWQEFSVKETAFMLSISEGSVKTHYYRAQNQLRRILGETE
jgi:RNA polymerase sigma-70 factor (ECF subfamily)